MKFLKYADLYLAEHLHNIGPATLKTYRYTIKRFNEMYHNPELSLITKADVLGFIGKQKRAQARKHLINLKAMMNYALKEKYIKHNPVKEVKIPKLSVNVPLYFTREDWMVFYNAIDSPDLADICLTAIYTGLRMGEIIRLKPQNIYNDTIVITSLKSMVPRSIPMNDKVREIISRRINNHYIFTYKDAPWRERRLQYKFNQTLKKTRLNPALHFHSLRHTFATWLVLKNVSIKLVQELMGHQDIKTTMIYSHFNNQNLRESINKL